MSEAFKLLLVDDDTMILELLVTRLQAAGYVLRTATDGEKGHVAARDFRPDLILCDIVMPHLDGPSLCRRMRAEGNHIPFLFLTAKGQPGDKVEVLSAGADDYLVKPFHAQELLARIQVILRRNYPGRFTA